MSGTGSLRDGSSASSYPTSSTRRSIARRSCQLCRHRKTRCELPDPTVPDGPSPLPEARKCHRCRVLGEECVVSAAGARAGSSKKRKAGDSELEQQAQVPTSIRDGVGERVELLTTFDPEGHGPSGSGGGPNRRGESSMQYHTRPITLTSAMLRRAFPADADDSEPEDEASIEGLQAAFDRLLLFHPTIPDLSHPKAEASPSEQLLRRLIVYLCGLYMYSPSPAPSSLHSLSSHISRLQDDVLRQLPRSLDTVHALQLLEIFAPFGVLPGQAVSDTSSLGKTEILRVACSHVLHDIQGIGGAHFSSASDDSTTWTTLVHFALRIASELERDRSVVPVDLGAGMETARSFLRASDHQEWARHLAGSDATAHSRALGKLALCDRIIREGQVLQTLQAMYSSLDRLSRGEITGADVVMIGVQELSKAKEAREETEDKVNALMSQYSLDPNEPLVRSWLSYRTIHSAHNEGKLQRTSLRLLIAMHYLSSSPSHSPAERLQHALQKSYHTPDVLAFFMAQPRPIGVELLPSLTVARKESLERILGGFLGLLSTDLQPWHDLWAIAVDSTSVFMEMQAGSIMLVGALDGEKGERELRRRSRIREWGGAKAQLLGVTDVLSQGEAGASSLEEGKTTVGGMCNKVVRGMIGVMDGRIRWLAQTPVNSTTTTPPNNATLTGSIPTSLSASGPDHALPYPSGLTASAALQSNNQQVDMDKFFAEFFNNDYDWTSLADLGDPDSTDGGPFQQ